VPSNEVNDPAIKVWEGNGVEIICLQLLINTIYK